MNLVRVNEDLVNRRRLTTLVSSWWRQVHFRLSCTAKHSARVWMSGQAPVFCRQRGPASSRPRALAVTNRRALACKAPSFKVLAGKRASVGANLQKSGVTLESGSSLGAHLEALQSGSYNFPAIGLRECLRGCDGESWLAIHHSIVLASMADSTRRLFHQPKPDG